MASTIFNINQIHSSFFEKTSIPFDEFYLSRLNLLVEKQKSLFGKKDNFRFFSSPGRIEISGNHTDHQKGKVLSGAVNLDTLACVHLLDSNKVQIESDGYPIISLDLDDLSFRAAEVGTSSALVRGVLAYFAKMDKNIGGFCATCHSTVFKGAGISSSASFEVLIACILNELFNNGSLDPLFLASAAHYAEQDYFGKPCGLLDQCAIACGGISYFDFLPNTPKVETLRQSLPLDVILVNTGGSHANLTDEYASIPNEMINVANYFGEKVLGNVKPKVFFDALPNLRQKFDGRTVLRAVHFFDENQRVVKTKNAILKNSVKGFAKHINESGNSSLCYLQNCYVKGDTEQVIPSAVELLRRLKGVKAARVHGGGFAGTVIAYAEKSEIENLKPILYQTFGKENCFIVNVRPTGAIEITKDILNND